MKTPGLDHGTMVEGDCFDPVIITNLSNLPSLFMILASSIGVNPLLWCDRNFAFPSLKLFNRRFSLLFPLLVISLLFSNFIGPCIEILRFNSFVG